jgi:DNA-binding MarR family transcriptional regulator
VVDPRPSDEVLLGLARLVMDVSVRAAEELGDVSPVQLRALTVLREAPAANLAQLAEAMGVTVSTTSRLVDRLIAAGWVDRRQSPENRREVRLTLTGPGKGLLRRYDAERVTALRDCLAQLPTDRREAVAEALEEFRRAADR